jgi:hypothetical protein
MFGKVAKVPPYSNKTIPSHTHLTPTTQLDLASLFEIDRSHWLYPDDRSELEAVCDRRKLISVTIFESFDSPRCAEYSNRAHKLGLVFEQRTVHNKTRGITAFFGFACHADQRWRVDAIALLHEEQPYRWSEAMMYFRSVLYGYSHEQARSYVEFQRHLRAPGGVAIFFTCGLKQRTALELIRGAAFLVDNPETIEIFCPLHPLLALRRDALERLPSTLSIGRVSVTGDGVYEQLFEGGQRTADLCVTRCNESRAALIRDSAISRVEFWRGDRWSCRPDHQSSR